MKPSQRLGKSQPLRREAVVHSEELHLIVSDETEALAILNPQSAELSGRVSLLFDMHCVRQVKISAHDISRFY